MTSEEFWPRRDADAEEIPEVLYHYTSRAGLTGICTNKQLWASSSQFLNDSTELNYAAQIISEVAQSLKKETRDWFELQLLGQAESFGKETAKGFQRQVFFFSLSTDHDSLSQWRGYGRPGDSYAIGFSTACLQRLSGERNIKLARCIYDPTQQVTAIRSGLVHALAEFKKHGFKQSDIQGADAAGVSKAIAKFTLTYVQLAALVKHPAFKEEQEWRLIMMIGNRDVKFRSGTEFLKPYLIVPTGTLMHEGMIRSIVVGPTNHFELDKASLAWFLNEQFGGSIPIVESTAPFRSA
jgi:hypothetical protein